jgi:polar amino acid transport system substrate-binding protein
VSTLWPRLALRQLAVIVLAFVVALAVGCGDSDEPESAASSVSDDCTPKLTLPTMKEGVLTVAAPQYPPLFTFEDGKAGGVDGEILNILAKQACLELEVRIDPAAGVIESVQAGRADLAAGGWYITPDRAEVVSMTDPIYSDPPVLVSKEGVSRIADLEDKTVGTTQGYLWVDDLKQYLGDGAKLYQSPDAVFQDVANGRVDAGLMAVAEATYRLEQNPDTGLKSALMEPDPAIDASVRPSVTNFPHTKGKTEVTKVLNSLITELRENGRLAEILGRNGIDERAADVSE